MKVKAAQYPQKMIVPPAQGCGLYKKAEGFSHSAYEKAVGMKYRWAEMEAGSLPTGSLSTTYRDSDSGCGGFVGGDKGKGEGKREKGKKNQRLK